MGKSKRTVRVFGAASFLNDLGSDMVFPIWPLFVTSVLGVDMAMLGFIDGLGDALASISSAVGGHYSDRLKRRKPFIWLGYLMGSLSRVGYALSPAWQWLIPFKAMDRAGKMRGAPRDAMVADASTHRDRGASFGFLRAADNLGAVVGILLCIALFPILGYTNLFLLAAVPSVASAALIMALIREKPLRNVRLYKGMLLKDLSRDFRLFLASSTLFSLGFFSYSFLIVFAKDVGYSIVFIPILYLAFTAVASLSSMPFGMLADRVGRKAVLFASFAFFAAMCAVFVWWQSLPGIALAFVLYGLHLGARQPVEKAFVSELAVKKYRASSLGAYQMAVGLCALPASIIAGVLWVSVGREAPFAMALALTALASILLLFVREGK